MHAHRFHAFCGRHQAASQDRPPRLSADFRGGRALLPLYYEATLGTTYSIHSCPTPSPPRTPPRTPARLHSQWGALPSPHSAPRHPPHAQLKLSRQLQLLHHGHPLKKAKRQSLSRIHTYAPSLSLSHTHTHARHSPHAHLKLGRQLRLLGHGAQHDPRHVLGLLPRGRGHHAASREHQEASVGSLLHDTVVRVALPTSRARTAPPPPQN